MISSSRSSSACCTCRQSLVLLLLSLLLLLLLTIAQIAIGTDGGSTVGVDRGIRRHGTIAVVEATIVVFVVVVVVVVVMVAKALAAVGGSVPSPIHLGPRPGHA